MASGLIAVGRRPLLVVALLAAVMPALANLAATTTAASMATTDSATNNVVAFKQPSAMVAGARTRPSLPSAPHASEPERVFARLILNVVAAEAVGGDWPVISGIVRDAAKGKGNSVSAQVQLPKRSGPGSPGSAMGTPSPATGRR